MLLMLAVCAVAVAQEGCPEYGRLIREAADYSGRGLPRGAIQIQQRENLFAWAALAVDSMINLLFVKTMRAEKGAGGGEPFQGHAEHAS